MTSTQTAWTVAAAAGAAMVSILTIMLAFIGQSQRDQTELQLKIHDRLMELERRQCE